MPDAVVSVLSVSCRFISYPCIIFSRIRVLLSTDTTPSQVPQSEDRARADLQARTRQSKQVPHSHHGQHHH